MTVTNKAVYGQQSVFKKQLDDIVVKKNTNKNISDKNFSPNIGEKYFIYLTKLDKQLLQEPKLYASTCFPDDNKAIRSFRKQVRDELLKQYSIVIFEIITTYVDENNKVCRRVVGEYTEDRVGRQQRMLQFLHRDIFNS